LSVQTHRPVPCIIRQFGDLIRIGATKEGAEPPADPPVMTGRNHDKPAHGESRNDF
jgi:hypothetical protein